MSVFACPPWRAIPLGEQPCLSVAAAATTAARRRRVAAGATRPERPPLRPRYDPDSYDAPPRARRTPAGDDGARSGFDPSGDGDDGGDDLPPPPKPGWLDGFRGGPSSASILSGLVGGAFLLGIGFGVAFDSVVTLDKDNVTSQVMFDRSSPNAEACAAYGASAVVFDQRIFLSFNPFNVYVSQPELKPGCVLRRSNWSVLEKRRLVEPSQEDDCKKHLNTFAFVGDLEGSPEVSCVYHSEQAENQYLRDPASSVLGDGKVDRRVRNLGTERDF